MTMVREREEGRRRRWRGARVGWGKRGRERD